MYKESESDYDAIKVSGKVPLTIQAPKIREMHYNQCFIIRTFHVYLYPKDQKTPPKMGDGGGGGGQFSPTATGPKRVQVTK